MIVNCNSCNKEIIKSNKDYNQATLRGQSLFYCSPQCKGKAQLNKIEICCANCNTVVQKISRDIKKSKSGNLFCSRSCSTTYANTHKIHGNRKSKLEYWLENKLTLIYPNLTTLYAYKEAINAELDIYIPSLNLAFELNGIYHYEPIHGQNKLNQIQNNDKRKFQACLEMNIELCIIDTSQHKYVKDSTNQKYLDIIKNIIDFKLNLVTE